MDLKGKKLLILGGNIMSCEIVNAAKKMGIYTIVTDWYDTNRSPAKLIADEYWNEEVFKPERLAQLVKEREIDGVFTNFTDSYLPQYAKLCKLTGLPCLADENQIEIISNKDQSKQLCINHGISVSKRYQVFSIEDIDNLTDVKYPVLTKPVDNSGQRGIYVCQNKDELKEKFVESLSFSESKNVMVEEYVQGDYTVSFFHVQNGNVTLATMADKPVYGNLDNNLPKLPCGYFLPSKHIALCERRLLPGVKSFVADLGIKNGVIGVESVVRENDIFVFEMQFRLGGMKHYDFVLRETGMDIMSMLIRFSVTGKFEGWETAIYDNPRFKRQYCLLNVLIKPEKVAKIENLDMVKNMPFVDSSVQKLFVGDSVKLPGTVQQIFCKFSLETEDKASMAEAIDSVFNNLKVYNEKGENVVINTAKLLKDSLLSGGGKC